MTHDIDALFAGIQAAHDLSADGKGLLFGEAQYRSLR
jgi:hypothetical protein